MHYTTNTSKERHILWHLTHCDHSFLSILSSKVDIYDFVSKIYKLTTRFECWDNKNLVGLVSAYTNNPVAFINHVGVIQTYGSRGIATELLALCTSTIDKTINLEVDKTNTKALRLYKKFGFVEISNNVGSIFMGLKLNEKL